MCEHVSSSVTRFHADGFREPLLPPRGVYLNSPNDLVASVRDGSIYFTDPTTADGTTGSGNASRCSGSRACSACRHEGGEAQLVVDRDEFEQPNGLCFSPTNR